MPRSLICLLIVLAAATARAQYPDYSFTNYTVANGLADNHINTILEDDRGFMWFGTREGLSRFDGTGFKNYFSRRNDSTALPGNNIHFLHEYKPGYLLFTANGMLTAFNTFCGQFRQVSQMSGKSLSYLGKASAHTFFAGIADTCFVLDVSLTITDTLVPPVKRTKFPIYTYVLDDTTWLIGTQRQYFLYHTRKKTYTLFALKTTLPETQQLFPFQYYDARHKQLYFSNFWSGLYQYSLAGDLLNHWSNDVSARGLNNNNVACVVPKNDSIWWIGTYEGGLHIFNNHTGLFTRITNDRLNPGSLPNNSVAMTYTSRDGNEWFATLGGIGKLNATTAVIANWQTEFRRLSGDINLMNVQQGSDGYMYAQAFARNQTYKIHPGTGSVRLLDSSQLPSVWCMRRLGSELVFTGNSTKVTKYDPVTGRYTRSDLLKKYYPTAEAVVMVFQHSNGDTWYSANSGGGFVRVAAKDGTIHHYKKDGPNGSFALSYYFCYAEDKDGDLWFGVNKSDRLLHWHRQTDRFTEIALNEVKGLQGHALSGVSDIIMDNDNNLWVAFDGVGLAKYNIRNNSAEHYSIQDGLPTNYLYSLQFDNKNRLWTGTRKGLSCFMVNQKKFINFSRADGLPDDHFIEHCIYFDSAANKMWVGSVTTLMAFDPDVLLGMNRKKMPVYIDQLTVNGKTYLAGDTGTLSLSASENNLQFYFIGVDINNGKDIEYGYRLSGGDNEWIDNGDIATASFANLLPGDYVFSVRARHKGDNEWTFMQYPVHFTIRPHWWQTWWFSILLVIGLVWLVVAFVKAWFARKLQKQKIIMEKELAIEQERTRMARELHDGLGSMLSGIKHSFTAMQNQLTLDTTRQLLFHSNIDKLNETIKELRNISHSMASDSLLKYGLENSLRDYCQNITESGELRVSFTAIDTAKLQLSEEQSFHIFRIVQELLWNIMKHAATDTAILQISCNAKRLYIAVEDSGKGFELQQAHQKGGMGLKNIESRIRILKGRMDYRTAPDRGTSVLIEIPL